MGTIIADSSHFTAFHRDIMQCQATVMPTGFPSLVVALQLLPENVALILPPGVLRPGFRMVRCPSSGIASRGSFGGRGALLILVRVASLLPPDDKTVPAFTFTCFQEVFGNRSYLIIFPPLGSTFQRTPRGEWRLSVSFGVTLRVPAPALVPGRLSPVRSGKHPS